MCRLANLLLVACLGFVVFSKASAQSVGANCVDHCVVELCRLKGVDISPGELDAAISCCGQTPGAAYRSLSECLSLLRALGMEPVAIVIDHEDSGPPSGIYYCRLDNSDLPGHVIVADFQGEGQVSVFDPQLEGSYTTTMTVSEFHELHDGIAIVDWREYYTVAFRSFVSVFGRCALAAAAFLLLLVGVRWFIRPGNRTSLVGAGSLVLALAMASGGCSSKEPLEQYVVEKTIDLGIVRVPAKNMEVRFGGFFENCNFEIRNPYKIPVKITNFRSSCGCITTLARVKGTEIEPGGLFVLPMKVRLDEKYGDFEVPMWLKIKGAEVSDVVLRIKGVAVHPPSPVEELVPFESSGGQQVTEDVTITYLRHGDRRAAWKSFALTPDGESNDCFTLGIPVAKEGVRFDGGAVDKWVFPVTYRPLAFKSDSSNAKLVVAWRHPAGETSTVNLVGKTVLPLEVDRYYFFPNVMSGERHVESVPIRILEPGVLEHLSVSSDTEGVECTIDSSSQRMNVSFDGFSPGERVNGIIEMSTGKEGRMFSSTVEIEALVK